jgi:hypothetical protein
MTLHLPVNMEALVSAFLRDQSEVTDLVEDRVYTSLPKAITWPAVRVTQILDSPTGGHPLWGVAFNMQVEAWGGSKGDAWRIAATCRAAIDARIIGVHEGYGVVNGTDPASMFDLPDEDFEPAKPRWIVTCTIYGHPLATIDAS